MKNLLMAILAMLVLGLSACEKKSRITGSGNDEQYCKDHPAECAVFSSNEVRP